MRSLFFVLSLSVFILQSCGTVLKVSERGPNGEFSANKSAKIIKGQKFDLDQHSDLLIVPNSDYMRSMANNINFFKEVKTVEEFEKEIITSGKAEEIGNVSGQIGLHKAYTKFKKFLYLRYDNNPDNEKMLQLKLINPDNFEDLFIAEIKMPSSGPTDGNTFNPLFNGLITYIGLNSDYSKRKYLKKK